MIKKRMYCLFCAAIFAAIVITACGGGGGAGDDGSDDDTAALVGSPEELYDNAMTVLGEGNIQLANDYFNAAISNGSGQTMGVGTKEGLDLSEIITQSYFGSALTRIILLAESAPVTEMLAGFGQSPWSVGTVFGQDGFFGRANDIRSADEVDISISGAATADISELYGRTGFGSNVHSSGYDDLDVVYLKINEDTIGSLYLTLNTNIGGGTGSCNIASGDELVPGTLCTVNYSGSDVDVHLINYASYGSYGLNDYTRSKSAGSITIDQMGTAVGEVISVTFNDLKLLSGDEYILLNGTFVDRITEASASRDGLPFHAVCPKGVCFMSQVVSGYNSSELISSIDVLQPLFDEIIFDLENAVSDAMASFDIPKELYFGDRDMHVTHADMLATLASMYAAKAGSNFANSWSADIALDNLVDLSGNVIADKTFVVEQLNEFFRLREDHQLSRAQDNLVQAISYALQSVDEVIKGATGGLVDPVSDSGPFIEEVYDLLYEASETLSGLVFMDALNPSIGVDMAYFFDNFPDGGEIQYDPFILNGGQIEGVEAYFMELMKNVCTYDLDTKPSLTIFSDAVRGIHALRRKIFPNVLNTRVAGRRLMEEQMMNF